MPDLNKIYRLILADILERLQEKTIDGNCAISRICEVSNVFFRNTLDPFNEVHFRNYVQEHYPQYYKELTNDSR